MPTLQKALEITGKASLTVDGRTMIVEQHVNDFLTAKGQAGLFWLIYEPEQLDDIRTILGYGEGYLGWQGVEEMLEGTMFDYRLHSWQFAVDWEAQKIMVWVYGERQAQFIVMVGLKTGLAYSHNEMTGFYDIHHVASGKRVADFLPEETDAQEAIRRLIVLGIDWNRAEVPERLGKRALADVVREEVEKSIGWLQV